MIDVDRVAKRLKEFLEGRVALAAEDGDADRVRELEGLQIEVCDPKTGRKKKVKADPFAG
jgi:hypothetical protein